MSDKILDIIRKLHRKATDPSVSAEESAAFAAKVSELLEKHKIDAALLGEPDGVQSTIDSDIFEILQDKELCSLLVGPLGQLAFCQAASDDSVRPRGASRQSTWFRVIGSPIDRQIFRYLFDAIRADARRMAVVHTTRNKERYARNDFLFGYGRRVAERCRELVAAREVSTQAGMALVLVSQKTQISAWMKDNGFTVRQTLHERRVDNASHEAGAEAGSKVNLNPGLNEAPSRSQLCST